MIATGMEAELGNATPGVLQLTGELDFANADALADLLQQIHPVDGRLTIDATGVSFMGVSALRTIVAAARETGGHVTMRNPPVLMQRVLEVCEWADDLDITYEQRFDIAWESVETEDVTLDDASARDLRLFLSRLPPSAERSVSRPVVLWRGGRRSIVQVDAVRASDGSWQLRLGAERSEDAAPDTPEVFDARLNDLAAMVWVTDVDRMAKAFNSAWLEFVGAQLADELGWGWMQHVHEDDLLALLGAYEAAQEARRGFEYSGRVWRADGRLWWLRLRAAPRIEDGEFRGFIGMCEPIGAAGDVASPTNSGLADLLPVADLAVEPAASVVERLARIERVLRVSRPAELLETRLLRQLASRWVDQHARLRERHDDIVLAVSEAATNAAEHAYVDAPGYVRLTCELRQATAQFRIRDGGRWQQPSSSRDHRGIALMNGLADDLYINHLADGTEVVLSFRV